ncbi:MAG: SHOCT domain-containing protein [Sulfurovum sp.]|uniref:SHOCT domain-containing protein n=1 Tax=Sulfurovum sp. TaxID=1969726 RepID=UPI002867C321|nr:SHOCT domain-containing protein [Sulfurovum sp.]MCO4844539.1 SHOCT domain-containing protein [Sulfurovum sp.]
MDYVGDGWGMGFGMWFVPILLVIIVIYFLKENTKGEEKHSSAQDILDRRYANGEIDTEEYEERSDALNKK